MMEKEKHDLLIFNGTILTLNSNYDIIEDGIVGITNGVLKRIEARNKDKELPKSQQVLDASGGIIMPGIINTHTHAPMTLFRGLADDLPLLTWLDKYIFPMEGKLTFDLVYKGTLLACAEMILSGTTTFCDGYFYEDAVAHATRQAGMRGVLGQGIIDFPAPGVPDPAENIRHAERFLESWQGETSLIIPCLFCHSVYTCTEKTLRSAHRLAEQVGVLFQIHTAETQEEVRKVKKERGVSPIQYLYRIGILERETLLVHVIWVDETDLECVKKSQASISVTTESEMKLASGIAPLPSFLAKGIKVGLGTDGCASNNNLDMFREMDTTAKLHKVVSLDPTVLDARTVLTLTTAEAAKTIGLWDQVGSLEAGKRADIIIIDTKRPHLTPIYNPYSHIVYAASGSDVRDVIIDGRIVMKDRRILTFDVEEVMRDVRRESAHLARGFPLTRG